MPVGNTGLHGLAPSETAGPLGRGGAGQGLVRPLPPPRAPSPVPLPQKLFPLQRSLTPGDCALWRPLAVGPVLCWRTASLRPARLRCEPSDPLTYLVGTFSTEHFEALSLGSFIFIKARLLTLNHW